MALRAAELLDPESDEHVWIALELQGYPQGGLLKEEDTVPPKYRTPLYRWADLLASGPEPRITYSPPDSDLLERIHRANDVRSITFLVSEPIEVLEEANTPVFRSDSIVQDDGFNKTIVTWVATMPVYRMQSIVKAVRSRVHAFALTKLVSIEFGEATKHLLEGSRVYVAEKMEILSPDLLRELLETLEKQESGRTDINSRIVVQNCLTFVQRITDILLRDSMIPESESRPSTGQTRNKLSLILAWAKKNSTKKLDEERELVKRTFNHFFFYSKSLQKTIDKQRHKDPILVSKDEVDRILVYLLTWLADLLRILDHANYEWES